jgi:hypothetical protein
MTLPSVEEAESLLERTEKLIQVPAQPVESLPYDKPDEEFGKALDRLESDIGGVQEKASKYTQDYRDRLELLREEGVVDLSSPVMNPGDLADEFNRVGENLDKLLDEVYGDNEYDGSESPEELMEEAMEGVEPGLEGDETPGQILSNHLEGPSREQRNRLNQLGNDYRTALLKAAGTELLFYAELEERGRIEDATEYEMLAPNLAILEDELK